MFRAAVQKLFMYASQMGDVERDSKTKASEDCDEDLCCVIVEEY